MDRLSSVTTHVTSKSQSLTITDNRTGKQYSIPIEEDTIRASDFKQIKAPGSKLLRCFDPGCTNTTSCVSKISYIEGDAGILRYRGYPIEQLAETSTFEEVAFLLIYGELPTRDQLLDFQKMLMSHSHIPPEICRIISGFRQDAHPMGMLMSCMAALGTFYADANPCIEGQNLYMTDLPLRNLQIYRILGAISTIAAAIERHRLGRPVPEVREDMGFAENFLYMMDALGATIPREDYRPHSKLVKALDILFILHAEHELNCSTSATRHISSSNADVYTSIAGGIGALYGPRHGGASEAVVRMLERIGKVDNVPAFIEGVKKREEKLMGFGHRVYKNYDPRARIVRRLAEEVFNIVGREQLIEVAMQLEKTAIKDNFFIERKLYPNVDFYSGLIYRAMGFNTEFFPLLFAVPRCAGWIAHWYEFQDDPDNRIMRPFQVYRGPEKRDFTELANRKISKVPEDKLQIRLTQLDKRRLNSEKRVDDTGVSDKRIKSK